MGCWITPMGWNCPTCNGMDGKYDLLETLIEVATLKPWP